MVKKKRCLCSNEPGKAADSIYYFLFTTIQCNLDFYTGNPENMAIVLKRQRGSLSSYPGKILIMRNRSFMPKRWGLPCSKEVLSRPCIMPNRLPERIVSCWRRIKG